MLVILAMGLVFIPRLQTLCLGIGIWQSRLTRDLRCELHACSPGLRGHFLGHRNAAVRQGAAGIQQQQANRFPQSPKPFKKALMESHGTQAQAEIAKPCSAYWEILHESPLRSCDCESTARFRKQKIPMPGIGPPTVLANVQT